MPARRAAPECRRHGARRQEMLCHRRPLEMAAIAFGWGPIDFRDAAALEGRPRTATQRHKRRQYHLQYHPRLKLAQEAYGGRRRKMPEKSG